MVKLRCPVISLESIGTNYGMVCHREKAEATGYSCPKLIPGMRWKPGASCLNLNRLKAGPEIMQAVESAVSSPKPDQTGKTIVMS